MLFSVDHRAVSPTYYYLFRFSSLLMRRSGQMSDSEAEDEPASKVTLPQSLSSRGAKAGAKSAVRLVELGPRIRMQLLKIEEGLVEGEVLYHQFIVKTEQEKKLIRQRREQRRYRLRQILMITNTILSFRALTRLFLEIPNRCQ